MSPEQLSHSNNKVHNMSNTEAQITSHCMEAYDRFTESILSINNVLEPRLNGDWQKLFTSLRSALSANETLGSSREHAGDRDVDTAKLTAAIREVEEAREKLADQVDTLLKLSEGGVLTNGEAALMQGILLFAKKGAEQRFKDWDQLLNSTMLLPAALQCKENTLVRLLSGDAASPAGGKNENSELAAETSSEASADGDNRDQVGGPPSTIVDPEYGTEPFGIVDTANDELWDAIKVMLSSKSVREGPLTQMQAVAESVESIHTKYNDAHAEEASFGKDFWPVLKRDLMPELIRLREVVSSVDVIGVDEHARAVALSLPPMMDLLSLAFEGLYTNFDEEQNSPATLKAIVCGSKLSQHLADAIASAERNESSLTGAVTQLALLERWVNASRNLSGEMSRVADIWSERMAMRGRPHRPYAEIRTMVRSVFALAGSRLAQPQLPPPKDK